VVISRFLVLKQDSNLRPSNKTSPNLDKHHSGDSISPKFNEKIKIIDKKKIMHLHRQANYKYFISKRVVALVILQKAVLYRELH
jgi:hypothetical protein